MMISLLFPLLTIIPVRSQWGRYNPHPSQPFRTPAPHVAHPLRRPRSARHPCAREGAAAPPAIAWIQQDDDSMGNRWFNGRMEISWGWYKTNRDLMRYSSLPPIAIDVPQILKTRIHLSELFILRCTLRDSTPGQHVCHVANPPKALALAALESMRWAATCRVRVTAASDCLSMAKPHSENTILVRYS